MVGAGSAARRRAILSICLWGTAGAEGQLADCVDMHASRARSCSLPHEVMLYQALLA